MIISYITSLPIGKAHADEIDIGIAIKQIPVRHKVIELDVMAIITNVSNDFNIVVNVVYFSYFFLDLLFLYLKYVIISLMLFTELLKPLTSFSFFSSRCSESIFSNGADGYNLSVFCSIYIVNFI